MRKMPSGLWMEPLYVETGVELSILQAKSDQSLGREVEGAHRPGGEMTTMTETDAGEDQDPDQGQSHMNVGAVIREANQRADPGPLGEIETSTGGRSAKPKNKKANSRSCQDGALASRTLSKSIETFIFSTFAFRHINVYVFIYVQLPMLYNVAFKQMLSHM